MNPSWQRAESLFGFGVYLNTILERSTVGGGTAFWLYGTPLQRVGQIEGLGVGDKS